MRQPFPAHKEACQLSPTLHFTSTYDQFKNPSKGKAVSKRIDSGVTTYLQALEVDMEKLGTSGSPREEKAAQIAASNCTIARTNRTSRTGKHQNEPLSSRSSESFAKPVSPEEAKEPTGEGSEKRTTPKTPGLGRLPTPDLSDLECGSFCACCKDDDGIDDMDVKK
ncbi:hypothetical protein FQN54_006857 [Arachnomyces sp. PD_36]|nr:hypothetical protein FQN54_006857 [Arachnomyces sp. PD_36]